MIQLYLYYLYIFLLIIGILFLLEIFNLSFHSPRKIRIIVTVIVLVMLLRYITLLILFFASGIQYLYLLKPVFFMNFIGVPIIAVTVLYIFLRKDNVNFSYSFIFSALIIILYTIAMYKCTCYIQNLDVCGYTLILKDTYMYWVYIGVNTIVLFLAIYCLLDKSNINKIGICFTIIASLVTISEMVLWIAGITLIPERIIGDGIWILSLIYALKKTAKVNKK